MHRDREGKSRRKAEETTSTGIKVYLHVTADIKCTKLDHCISTCNTIIIKKTYIENHEKLLYFEQ